MRVRVTPIPVVPPRAVSIAPPELDRAAPLPPTRDQGWGNSRPPAPADQRAERQRRSRRVFTPSAPFNRPWTFARKPARRGSKCVASSGRPHSSRASHARREENSKTWYRPELVPAEVGFRGDFVEIFERQKLNPQNLGSQIKESACSQLAKNMTHIPISNANRIFVSNAHVFLVKPHLGGIKTLPPHLPLTFARTSTIDTPHCPLDPCRLDRRNHPALDALQVHLVLSHPLRVSILFCLPTIFSWRLSNKIGTFFVTRSAQPPDPRARRRYLSVFPSRSARST